MARFRLLFLVFLLVSAPTDAAETPRWIVVLPPDYREAVEPLCRQRRAQGYEVVVLTTTDVVPAADIRAGRSDRLRAAIRAETRKSAGPCSVLLVGAVEALPTTDASRSVVPPTLGTDSRMRGQPTDHGYTDPDEKQMPRVAVGRFPARSAAEAADMVRKTLAMENDVRPGEWRRRITVLAGIPAFNPLVDRMVERMAMSRIDQLHPSYFGRGVYHNRQSRFCVPDDVLNRTSLDYVQAGQLVTLYLGHSDPTGFWAGRAHFLDREDWSKLAIPEGPGIFATFGCLGCQLRGSRGEGYGIAAMRNPRGPVAVVGSHGICFAAMTQLASEGFIASLKSPQMPERLGEVWLGVCRGLAEGKMDEITYRLLDAVDGDPMIPQPLQRREHLEMFQLLGDPALKLPVLPADIRLQAKEEIAPGQNLEVTGELPARLAGARVRLRLERPLSSQPTDLQPLPEDPAGRDRVMLENHRRSNAFLVAEKDVTAEGRAFHARIELPPKLEYRKLLLRAYAVSGQDDGCGVQVLRVAVP